MAAHLSRKTQLWLDKWISYYDRATFHTEIFVQKSLGVREAGPRGPRDYLIVLFSSNEKKHVK
jgi:hypothetical protein